MKKKKKNWGKKNKTQGERARSGDTPREGGQTSVGGRGADDEEGEKEKYDMMFNGDVGAGGEKSKKQKKDSLVEEEEAVRGPLVAKRGHAEGGRFYGASGGGGKKNQ